jgi:hypothetical protein
MRISEAVLAAGAAGALFFTCGAAVPAEDHSLGESAVFLKTVPIDVLDAQRGKAVLTITDLEGAVHDNTAINSITGRNVITNGAFSNSSGVSTMIQNSGNNVLIQNATLLQLDVR